jgi:hypothetical protein
MRMRQTMPGPEEFGVSALRSGGRSGASTRLDEAG